MSHAKPEPRSSRYAGPVITGLFIGLIVAVILRPVAASTPSDVAWPVFLLEVVTPAIVALAAVPLSSRFGRMRRLFGGACVLVAVALVAGEIALVVSHRDNDHQRCVRSGTLVVLPASECAGTAGGAGGTGAGGGFWYYGGTGYRVGSTASDGSLTAPSDGVSFGGGAGDGGGDGGDSGGDGGDGGGGGGGGGD
jgi:hypothetical protein